MKSDLRIETPEGIVFAFTLASPVARCLAWALDAAVVATAGNVFGQITSVFGSVSEDWARALTALGYFVISTVYCIVLEWFWRGQTIGKKLFRLRVADAQGLRLHFSQVAMRNLLRAVDMLPLCYLVGGLASLFSGKAQRLGDLAANTVVIRELATPAPNLDQIAPAKYNSLAGFPHLAARLRSRTNPEAASLAVRALVERDSYEPSARLDLFADLAAYFSDIVAFPEEALEGLTDEQYVRSVVRVLYAAR